MNMWPGYESPKVSEIVVLGILGPYWGAYVSQFSVIQGRWASLSTIYHHFVSDEIQNLWVFGPQIWTPYLSEK